jgi:preprotein translocase subunit SecF
VKKTIRFSRGFVPAIIFSSIVLAFGVAGIFIFGFNLGVDFRAGINQTIRLAIPAMKVTYSGEGNAKLNLTETAAELELSGTRSADGSWAVPLAESKTLSGLAAALEKTLPGLKVEVQGDGGIAASAVLATASGDTRIGTEPAIVHRRILNESEAFAGIMDVRSAIEGVGESAVQTTGAKGDYSFKIRVEDDGKDPQFANNIKGQIKGALSARLGADKYVELKTDFVGARFSKDLGRQTIFVTGAAILAILIYAAIRFKPQYAIGAVLAIIHDALVMVAWIIWTGMEFNTSSIAAILTILGFSINDTIVIFDRIREDRHLRPDVPFKELLDTALSETLSRTIITTLTTLVCVTVLFFATSGTMKDFALALIVGMVSGTYSTIYIATAFVYYWQVWADKMKKNKADKAREAKAPQGKAAQGKPAQA